MKINQFSYFSKIKNIPNGITFFRILLIFPIILFLEIDLKHYVWYLILIGGGSDYIDGFLAKKFNQESILGAIIDPLADKIFIIILLTWLCIEQIIPYWSFSLIIFRELIISSIRVSKDNGMPAMKIAKYKSFFQFLSLLLIFYPVKTDITMYLGLTFYWISFILCIFSLFIYLRFK